jgi:hypothetical protein
MRSDAMVTVPTLPIGIDVDSHAAQMRQMMQQLVAYGLGDLVALADRARTLNGDAQVRVQPVTDPPSSHVRDFRDPRHVAGGVHDLLKRLSFDAVERPQEDRPS